MPFAFYLLYLYYFYNIYLGLLLLLLLLIEATMIKASIMLKIPNGSHISQLDDFNSGGGDGRIFGGAFLSTLLLANRSVWNKVLPFKVYVNLPTTCPFST